MDKRINIIKGIHPGKLIERDLKKKRLMELVFRFKQLMQL